MSEKYKFIFLMFFISSFLIPVASASVRINEIMYDVPGSDEGHEWIEIKNAGAEEINLSNWKFYEDETKHKLNLTKGSIVIAPSSFAVIVDNVGIFLSDYPDFDGSLFDSSWSSLSNSGELLALWNGSDIVRNMSYDAVLGAGGNNNSLQIIDDVWQECLPTPGKENICIQREPETNASENITINLSDSPDNESQSPDTNTSNESSLIINAQKETAVNNNSNIVANLSKTNILKDNSSNASSKVNAPSSKEEAKKTAETAGITGKVVYESKNEAMKSLSIILLLFLMLLVVIYFVTERKK